MDQQDPEKRIAELERQVAQQKRIAELERQLAEARAAAREDHPVEQPSQWAQFSQKGLQTGQASGPEVAQLRAELRRAAPRRKLVVPDRAGRIVGLIGAAIGVCVGGAAAVTAVLPSSALWMSGIVCSSPYRLDYNTSHYSYKPGQSGSSVSFQCVNGASFYDVNDLAIFGLQCLLAALVLCVAVAVGGPAWRRFRKPR